MIVIKVILIFFTVLFTLSKIVDGMNNKYIDCENRVLNTVEIAAGIILTFVVSKI